MKQHNDKRPETGTGFTDTPEYPPEAQAQAQRFFNTRQLAAQLGVSTRTLHNWRDRGLIPYIKLPGSRRVLFDAGSVRDALHRQERGGTAL